MCAKTKGPNAFSAVDRAKDLKKRKDKLKAALEISEKK